MGMIIGIVMRMDMSITIMITGGRQRRARRKMVNLGLGWDGGSVKDWHGKDAVPKLPMD
jgi:hypothetical protein